MDDLPTTAVSPDDPEPEGPSGLTRREFLLLAAIMGSSAVLLLARCRPPIPPPQGPLEIPPDFRRFLLAEPSADVYGEKSIAALGSQCPDLACALWWADTQEFEFFDNVDQITERYVSAGKRELIWLD
jgi:hypothetical protein